MPLQLAKMASASTNFQTSRFCNNVLTDILGLPAETSSLHAGLESNSDSTSVRKANNVGSGQQLAGTPASNGAIYPVAQPITVGKQPTTGSSLGKRSRAEHSSSKPEPEHAAPSTGSQTASHVQWLSAPTLQARYDSAVVTLQALSTQLEDYQCQMDIDEREGTGRERTDGGGQHMSSAEAVEHLHNKVSEVLAGCLREPNAVALWNTAVLLGVPFVLDLLRQTVEREKAGGMPTADGKRRRTAGGVFFFLLKNATDKDTYKVIFQEKTAVHQARVKAKRRAQTEAGLRKRPATDSMYVDKPSGTSTET